jgi:hypothetical protein
MHFSRLAVLVAVVVLGLLAACTGPAPSSKAPAPPSMNLSFVQQRIDEGTPRAQLRVVSRAKSDIVVTGIGLDWSGYGARFANDYRTTIHPHQTLDLPMVLPTPVCSEGSAPAYGVVELGGTTVRMRLDASGQRFARSIWQGACAKKYVTDRVDITYGATWRRVGSGSSAALAGTLRLTRRETPRAIRLLDIRGSVLLSLRLPRRVLLRSDSASADYPLRLSPVRCDEHALGQSTQTFVFRASVQFGDSKPVSFILEPDRQTKAVAGHLLVRACR